MKLSHLLLDFCDLPLAAADIHVTDLTLDSRQVKPGFAFLAVLGTHLDGRQFIDNALQQGATAILLESEHAEVTWRNTIPIISIPQLKNHVGELAARFYDYPAKKMRMVGVTGTSGKTSCTQFIAAALKQLNIACGVIGTLGSGLYGNIAPGSLTTPDAITLQKTLADFVQQGVTITAMEVSSHSLDQGRVNGLQFQIGMFTNLTRDHLDYHGTMAAYGAAKKRLFAQTDFAVINADDPFGRELLAEQKTFIALSTDPQNIAAYPADSCVVATHIQLTDAGVRATISSPWGEGILQSSLVGHFNLSNLLAALSALCLLDIPLKDALRSLQSLTSVPGRMQTFGGNDKPLVVVDYAHKPDALEKVLQALRHQCQGKLFCVFGCGGERDRGKRPLMAQIAEQYADQVIVTNDNPRHEDATQIVEEIMTGFVDKAKIIIQQDRSKAIHDVIQYAAKGDCILIAGKGAETYQQVGDVKIPFSDIEKVQEFLG